MNLKYEILHAIEMVVDQKFGKLSEDFFVPCEVVRGQTSIASGKFLRLVQEMERMGWVRLRYGASPADCTVAIAPRGTERLLEWPGRG